jgi:hypothetical protein
MPDQIATQIANAKPKDWMPTLAEIIDSYAGEFVASTSWSEFTPELYVAEIERIIGASRETS